MLDLYVMFILGASFGKLWNKVLCPPFRKFLGLATRLRFQLYTSFWTFFDIDKVDEVCFLEISLQINHHTLPFYFEEPYTALCYYILRMTRRWTRLFRDYWISLVVILIKTWYLANQPSQRSGQDMISCLLTCTNRRSDPVKMHHLTYLETSTNRRGDTLRCAGGHLCCTPTPMEECWKFHGHVGCNHYVQAFALELHILLCFSLIFWDELMWFFYVTLVLLCHCISSFTFYDLMFCWRSCHCILSLLVDIHMFCDDCAFAILIAQQTSSLMSHLVLWNCVRRLYV
jgi:hypothetical protein